MGALGAAGGSELRAGGSGGGTAPEHPSGSPSSDPWLGPAPAPSPGTPHIQLLRGVGFCFPPKTPGEEKGGALTSLKVRTEGALSVAAGQRSLLGQEMGPHAQNIDLHREDTQGSPEGKRGTPLMEPGWRAVRTTGQGPHGRGSAVTVTGSGSVLVCMKGPGFFPVLFPL